jgi:hypothetical protein
MVGKGMGESEPKALLGVSAGVGRPPGGGALVDNATLLMVEWGLCKTGASGVGAARSRSNDGSMSSRTGTGSLNPGDDGVVVLKVGANGRDKHGVC